MLFKLSLLLLLIFCSCHVSSKNLRKSLNQKADGYVEDLSYPNAAPGVKLRDGLFNGSGGEAQGKQHHVSIDDSSNLNSHIGKQNGHEFDGTNFDKQHKDVLAEIQHNGYSGNKETSAKKNGDSIFLSNNDKFGKQKHGRFRRGYYYYKTSTVSSGYTTSAISSKTITVWGIGMIVLAVFLPLLFCCCIIGLISWAVYVVAKQNRHVQPGVVYQ
uniref:Uncharacterized protein n=1 Tax=Panagrolaimus davidi TaxID=227884 RepID=A0A914QYC1_9BILA